MGEFVEHINSLTVFGIILCILRKWWGGYINTQMPKLTLKIEIGEIEFAGFDTKDCKITIENNSGFDAIKIKKYKKLLKNKKTEHEFFNPFLINFDSNHKNIIKHCNKKELNFLFENDDLKNTIFCFEYVGFYEKKLQGFVVNISGLFHRYYSLIDIDNNFLYGRYKNPKKAFNKFIKKYRGKDFRYKIKNFLIKNRKN